MTQAEREKQLERFTALYEPVTESGCWLWIGAERGNGYGGFWDSSMQKYRRAHVVAYELYRAPIPVGLQIDHLCRVRLCVNPDHLEAVTQRTNLLRGESFSAINAVKTHCKRGHPFAGDNLSLDRRGYRLCRECGKMNGRVYYYRDVERERARSRSNYARKHGKERV